MFCADLMGRVWADFSFCMTAPQQSESRKTCMNTRGVFPVRRVSHVPSVAAPYPAIGAVRDPPRSKELHEDQVVPFVRRKALEKSGLKTVTVSWPRNQREWHGNFPKSKPCAI